MSLDRPRDFFEVVRANARRTRGFLWAVRPPGIGFRERELAVIDRDLHPTPVDLQRLQPPDSWIFAVILSPGDDTTEAAAWARRLPARDLDRIRFYATPNVDLGQALAGWMQSRLPAPRADQVADWKEFHRLFGLDLNDRAYLDTLRAGT